MKFRPIIVAGGGGRSIFVQGWGLGGSVCQSGAVVMPTGSYVTLFEFVGITAKSRLFGAIAIPIIQT